MSRKSEGLTKIEWSLMKICWNQGEATARVIYEESLREKNRSYQAVKTMLDRLAVKGFLSRKKFGPLWLYKPTVSHAKTIGNAIENFVTTVLDNTFAPILVHFSKKEKISPEEIEAIKKIIQEHSNE